MCAATADTGTTSAFVGVHMHVGCVINGLRMFGVVVFSLVAAAFCDFYILFTTQAFTSRAR